MSSRLASLAAVVLIALTAALALHFASAPTALPATAPPEVFSAGRAREHLARIAARPHPVGSQAHREVREYLVDTVRGLGVTPEVQATAAIHPHMEEHSIPGATVHNVLAHVKGQDSRGVIAIVAHYDSVPTSPGASDDGAGVAAMLETLRALRTGPPLRNDVLFVFTDAEETGLVGARAFAFHHPLAEQVSVVLNFEARGSHGPSLMFQPGPGNRWLIQHLARSGAPAQASSLFDEVYRRLQNDTDFTVFLQRGKTGLNFGFLDGFMRYHARTDDLAHFGLDSLQHHGEVMLALARHLGDDALEPAPPEDAVYFNAGPILVHHPATWAVPIALLALLAVAAAMVQGLRRGRLRASGLAWGAGTLLAATVASAVAVQAAWWLVVRIDGGLGVLPQGDAYHGTFFIAGLLALTLSAVIGVQALFQRRAHAEELVAGAGVQARFPHKALAEELVAGALAVWAVLGVLSAFAAPGLSYLFAVPALVGALALGGRLRGSAEQPSARGRLLLAVSAIPALLLWVPQVLNLYVALTLAMAAVATLAVAPFFAFLWPQVFAPITRPGRTVALPVLALACVLLGVGVVRERFDASDPRPSSIAYAVDASLGEAYWLSSDFEVDAWASRFVSAEAPARRLDSYLPRFWRDVRVTPAPHRPLPAPSVRVTQDETRDGLRRLLLHVESVEHAPLLQVRFGAGTPLRTLTIAGQPVDASAVARMRDAPGGGLVEYWDVPPGGLPLELTVPEGTRVQLRATAVRYDLDQAPGAPASQRPEDTMPVPFGFAVTDETLVSVTGEY
ncbi:MULTISPECIES: M20/M25/M40 family metallo-hydrolase [unclassified Corallococcus]|uniref:M20/M25/M40 family metallo-hydrolase n=1 Tax=unclassified Corallococcus TaxID=2685029 RepID=UPI001A8D82C2|nr:MULTISPECIES: M20/M25/M40 family metallo-hydrolase [unclassified Corallococcus]MBN9681060.1 M20/M25/M40 family metallo-hydrolase [Corallococcus sp. NCSPR001]WAS87346.1 M20/M25/M40 family metallo-hydrolase [Corallococcus sp. NCRR]